MPLLSVASATDVSEARRQAWIATASLGLEPEVLAALKRIAATDRRLLALRAYLRAGDSLAERWSWSQERLALYPSTTEGKAATADIDAVRAAFAAANPGFALRVNRQPRSLDLQITRWNENASVGAVAADLALSLDRRFEGAAATPSTNDLRQALIDWRPSAVATLAAPGLSAHGQARAFDFEVEHLGQVIAGLNAASARREWDVAGWTQKLHAAVSAAGGHFTGPLDSPYEPWHYAYRPTP